MCVNERNFPRLEFPCPAYTTTSLHPKGTLTPTKALTVATATSPSASWRTTTSATAVSSLSPLRSPPPLPINLGGKEMTDRGGRFSLFPSLEAAAAQRCQLAPLLSTSCSLSMLQREKEREREGEGERERKTRRRRRRTAAAATSTTTGRLDARSPPPPPFSFLTIYYNSVRSYKLSATTRVVCKYYARHRRKRV